MLFIAIAALFIAGIGFLSVWQIESFVADLQKAANYQDQQKAALRFSLPFIVLSTTTLALLSFVIIKYIQRKNRFEQLLHECLEELEPGLEGKQVNPSAISENLAKLVEETNTQMNQLAHIVSHDLRAPLRTINSFTGLLKKKLDGRLSEKELAYMNFIQKDTMKLNRLLQEIAEFGRIEKFLIQPQVHDLSKILADAIQQCQIEIEATNSIINFPAQLPTIFCDGRKIKEVFIQIIRNAIRYSIPGSQPKLDIAVAENDSKVEFKFTDYGIGIPEGSLEKIFSPFVQLKAVKDQEGIGIGLAICVKYLELHEGSIACTSTEAGTTFSFQMNKELANHLQDFKVNLATTSI